MLHTITSLFDLFPLTLCTNCCRPFLYCIFTVLRQDLITFSFYCTRKFRRGWDFGDLTTSPMMPICQRRGEEKVHLAGCRFRAMTLSALHLVVNWPVFGRPFVKRFALCYRTVVCLPCLSVLSVTFVHCGQTVGRIKMKLGCR